MTVLGPADRLQLKKETLFILNSIAHHQVSFQKLDRMVETKFFQFLNKEYLVQTGSSETSPSKEDISFPAGDIIQSLASLYLFTATGCQLVRFALKEISTVYQYQWSDLT